VDVGNPIWNTFRVGNLYQISMDFELSKDSRKTDLNELCLDRLIEILISNVRELHFGQGLLHGDLKRLCYNLGHRASTDSRYPSPTRAKARPST
jgi:hypothetical protein